ncbi:MAG: hypothetical protein LBC86_08565 [Oscillospiraceae bacterium]|jgi:hypothetical protein|nr:hypothetical protein [Oscillospiraceae bacterium]
MLESIEQIMQNEIVKSLILLFLGGFFTYIFSIRQKKVDRQIKIDDSLVERRMALYKRIEDITIQLRQLEIIPRNGAKCEVHKKKLHTLLNKPAILYTQPIYNDIIRLKLFDETIKAIESEGVLLNNDIKLWLNLLRTYNENFISIYEKTVIPKYFITVTENLFGELDEKTASFIFLRYINIAALYDVASIGNRLEKSVQNFYASKNKINFKKRNFIITSINFYRCYLIFQNFNATQFFKKKKKNKTKTKKIMLTCLSCNEDCVLAGKTIMQEINKQI